MHTDNNQMSNENAGEQKDPTFTCPIHSGPIEDPIRAPPGPSIAAISDLIDNKIKFCIKYCKSSNKVSEYYCEFYFSSDDDKEYFKKLVPQHL